MSTENPTTSETVGKVIGDVASGLASTFLPAGVLLDIIKLAAKEGTPAVLAVIALLKKKDVTLDEVEATFANLKPLEAYGLPDKVPTVAGQ